jgi:RimJ/RimL family protein N-acetyltransferase
VASVSAVDVGIMAIKDFDLEFDATCWVGGCWTDPKFRGKGLLRAMFAYVDENADRNNWTVQGLDVWTDNEVAIRAFKAVGFVQAGESIASTRHSGKHYMRMIRKL